MLLYNIFYCLFVCHENTKRNIHTDEFITLLHFQHCLLYCLHYFPDI